MLIKTVQCRVIIVHLLLNAANTCVFSCEMGIVVDETSFS